MTAADSGVHHTRDELDITATLRVRPIQAAFSSAISFVAGAVISFAAVLLTPATRISEVSSAETALVS
jgi:hypothetical protein